eukprot:3485741-Alexandrium_andersonii.AAC.1
MLQSLFEEATLARAALSRTARPWRRSGDRRISAVASAGPEEAASQIREIRWVEDWSSLALG